MEYLEKEIHAIGDKVDEMYIALIGSPLTKDGGLIKRVGDLETITEDHQNRIEQIESNRKIIHFLYGLVTSAAGIYIIEKLTHLFTK